MEVGRRLCNVDYLMHARWMLSRKEVQILLIAPAFCCSCCIRYRSCSIVPSIFRPATFKLRGLRHTLKILFMLP